MAEEIPNPHDRFFKELLTHRATAEDFVRHYLPADFVAALDLRRLTVVKESFIDAALRQYFSDLLLRVRLKQGRSVYLYLLLEHKHTPDAFVALQLLVYLAQIWLPFLRKRTQPLPLVFPVVFYHGTPSWQASRSFQALFDFTGLEMLRPYVPEFAPHFCDLSKLEITKGGARLRAGLLALKYVASEELPARLREIFLTVKQLPVRLVMGYIRTVLIYFLSAKAKLSEDNIRLELATTFADRKEELMRSLADTWIKEGEQRGKQIGEQQGAAKIILRQLQRRFGTLGMELRKRIRALATKQLEDLSDALLFFSAKDDVLTWLQTNAAAPAKPRANGSAKGKA